MTSPTELKAGDRVQVVLVVTSTGSDWTSVQLEGTDARACFWREHIRTAGTLLPQPLQVGDRVRRLTDGTATGIIRYIEPALHENVRSVLVLWDRGALNLWDASDLTRVEDAP